VDLELTDEQTWLSESLDTLLTGEWTGAEAAFAATDADRRRLWSECVRLTGLELP
jgi:hypothetical protein